VCVIKAIFRQHEIVSCDGWPLTSSVRAGSAFHHRRSANRGMTTTKKVVILGGLASANATKAPTNCDTCSRQTSQIGDISTEAPGALC
jgi:hypothetical protein